MNYSENTKRIAKNTLMLYVRMLFNMLVSLYTSRVVLNALGVEDYGIYNVVGGFVAMFSLVSGSLSAAVSRFLTFELGKGNIERLKRVFSTSFFIHVALSLIVIVLSETFGVWFLNTRMTIPPERLFAANWVFQASIFSFVLSLCSIAFNATMIAHEQMKIFAYMGMLDTVLRLFIVLFIAYVPFLWDKLIVYATLLILVGVLMQIFYLYYCRAHFAECQLHFSFDKPFLKEIGAFAGWNFIGASSGLFKDQGVNILLNLFVGPVLNAARGIANSVNTAIYAFAANFMTAINPQITKSYAAGDTVYMISLVERGTRFSFYVMFMLALPILFETEFVLTLWLKQFPAHTVNFVRLILVLSLCDILSNTLITLQLATGKIKNYQIAVGGMQMINFPLSYLCLKLGYPPESTFIVAIIISLANLLLRLYFLKKMVGLSPKRYLRNVCSNILMVTILSLVAPLLVFDCMVGGWPRFLLTSVVCLFSTGCFSYWVGCNQAEKIFIKDKIVVFKERIMG